MPSQRDLRLCCRVLAIAACLTGCNSGPFGSSTPRAPTTFVETQPLPPGTPAAGPSNLEPLPPRTLDVPSMAEARRLAAASFERLASAIKLKDFKSLYGDMAPPFRHGISLQKVTDGFRRFTDVGTDPTTANLKQLVVAPPPYFDEHGVLFVKGTVPAPSLSWHFSFGYLPVEQGWALTAMSISSHPQ